MAKVATEEASDAEKMEEGNIYFFIGRELMNQIRIVHPMCSNFSLY